MTALNVITWIFYGYLLLGMLLAPVLSFGFIHRIDSFAKGASIGFRLIIMPGIALLWPFILFRILSGQQAPEERTAHKLLLERDA